MKDFNLDFELPLNSPMIKHTPRYQPQHDTYKSALEEANRIRHVTKDWPVNLQPSLVIRGPNLPVFGQYIPKAKIFN